MDPSPRQRRQSYPVASAELGKQGTQSILDLDRNPQGLLSYEQMPEWYRDNKFIHHGYRPVYNSTRACLASWFYLHNETVNIFSHLVPAILFLVAEAFVYRHLRFYYPGVSLTDHFMFAFFLLTATVCLGMSAMFHTLMNHSSAVCEVWLLLDFFGIVILTLGNFLSGIHMIFYCEPILEFAYGVMVSVYHK